MFDILWVSQKTNPILSQRFVIVPQEYAPFALEWGTKLGTRRIFRSLPYESKCLTRNFSPSLGLMPGSTGWFEASCRPSLTLVTPQ